MKIIRLVDLIRGDVDDFGEVFPILDEFGVGKTAPVVGNVHAFDIEKKYVDSMAGKVFGKELCDSGGENIFVHEKEYEGKRTFDIYKCDVIGDI